MNRPLLVPALFALLGSLSCGQAGDSSPPSSLAQERFALDTTNGSNLNGSNLNGSNLNGSNLNGSNLNGTQISGMLKAARFAGVTVDGEVLEATWLTGSELNGVGRGNRTYEGADFLGAGLTGELVDGSTVPLRIDGVLAGSAPPSDVWHYKVSFRDASSNTWKPICPDAQGNPLPAVAVAGLWDYQQGVVGGGSKLEDPSRFTFACAGGAIAKCVGFGYRPWASLQGQSLAPFHQACTRLIRADYCGDGTSHTTNGRLINLYDALGVQKDTEPWFPEAEWTPRGARCFNIFNRSLITLCSSVSVQLDCGSATHFQTGTLLITETPVGPLGILPVNGLF